MIEAKDDYFQFRKQTWVVWGIPRVAQSDTWPPNKGNWR